MPPAAEAPRAAEDHGQVNILIVDDEPKNLTVLESVLDDPGYRLVRALSGDQALLALMADEFAVLVLDIRMPDMTGLELAQLIKERRKTAQVPIIFLTAYYNEDQHVLEGYGSGAVDYMHKPVNAAVLRSKVAVFAELHRKRRELEQANRTLLAEVTERRRAEALLLELNKTLDQRVTERSLALNASDARLRLATGAVGLGIWTWRPVDDGVVWENGWLHETLGVPRVDGPVSAARLSAEFIHPEDLGRFEQSMAGTVERAERFSFEGRFRHADGTLRWIEFTGHPVAPGPGEALSILGISRDITDRMLAQQSLRERERLLSTVTGAASIGLAVVGQGPVYRYANEAYVRMGELGVDAEALVGRSVRDLPVGEWELIGTRLEEAFAGHRVAFDITLAARREEGALPRYLGAFYEPHVDRDGQSTVVVVVVDMSDLRRMEMQLRDADRRKDEFLATLAHELRNPLAPVRNAVQVLRLKGPATLEVNWVRDVIDRQVQAMTRLIDDLMDLSRISLGKIELRLARTDLADVLQSAVEASRPLIEECRHELVLTAPGETLMVEADATRLTQVFMNLLNNAAKYMEPGGRIELSAERHGNEVAVTVKDWGIGIAADRQNGVFEMFSQVESALARSRGGLGIGLSLSRKFAEMHEGRIDVRSEGLGRGSEFVVYLPLLVDPPEMPGAATGAEPYTPGSTLRILVADDNADAALSLGMLLEALGNSVHVVHDGKAAVSAVVGFQPQVLVLDIGMPKLNGYEACSEIRALPGGDGRILIAVTGWGQPNDIRQAYDAGFDSHMVKPVDPVALFNTITELVARRLPGASGGQARA